jgi:phosphoadenosine phosphosulfate reductase
MSLIRPTHELLDELDSVNERFEHSAPSEILAWTCERFDGDVAMACSFEDVALLHMVHELKPDTEIIFLDTGGHFPETIEFATAVERDWSLNDAVSCEKSSHSVARSPVGPRGLPR